MSFFGFHPVIEKWFYSRFSAPTEPQTAGWPHIAAGKNTLIAAPTGSGKTLTMTHRIGNLVKKHGIAPENILGLTFTRNAAEAMREKLVPVLDDMASRVQLSTIHSFCHYLLRNAGHALPVIASYIRLAVSSKTRL